MFRKIWLQVVFMLLAGCAVDLQAQTFIIIVNPKDCLDPDPETAEKDSCPAGASSPWSECPTGACDSAHGLACVISAQNINFTTWNHFTDGFYFNPPKAAPNTSGKGAVEVDRMFCSFRRACPCTRLPGGSLQCIMVEYYEEWLIKYERSDTEVCIGGGLAP